MPMERSTILVDLKECIVILKYDMEFLSMSNNITVVILNRPTILILETYHSVPFPTLSNGNGDNEWGWDGFLSVDPDDLPTKNISM